MKIGKAIYDERRLQLFADLKGGHEPPSAKQPAASQKKQVLKEGMSRPQQSSLRQVKKAGFEGGHEPPSQSSLEKVVQIDVEVFGNLILNFKEDDVHD